MSWMHWTVMTKKPNNHVHIPWLCTWSTFMLLLCFDILTVFLCFCLPHFDTLRKINLHLHPPCLQFCGMKLDLIYWCRRYLPSEGGPWSLSNSLFLFGCHYATWLSFRCLSTKDVILPPCSVSDITPLHCLMKDVTTTPGFTKDFTFFALLRAFLLALTLQCMLPPPDLQRILFFPSVFTPLETLFSSLNAENVVTTLA